VLPWLDHRGRRRRSVPASIYFDFKKGFSTAMKHLSSISFGKYMYCNYQTLAMETS
jgi:hypothetical protein